MAAAVWKLRGDPIMVPVVAFWKRYFTPCTPAPAYSFDDVALGRKKVVRPQSGSADVTVA